MHILSSAAVGIGAALLLTPHVAAQSMYTKNSPVLQVDAKSWDRLIEKSHVPSIVEFYAPWCGHCKNLKPAYEKAAKSLEGLVQVAAVNCDEEYNKALCGKQGIQGFPTLKTVRLSAKGKPIIDQYQGQRSAKAIVDAGKALLPNNVKRVEDKDLAKWLAEKNETAKAIMFSSQGKTSATLKALANDFQGTLSVAQIRDKDEASAEMFGVTDYPTLVVLPGGEKDPVVYDGEMSKSEMTEWLKQYAEIRTRTSPGSSSGKVKDTKAKSKQASKSYEKAASSHAKEEASEAAHSAASETVEDPDEESPQPTMDDMPKPVKVPSAAKPLQTLASQAELQSACLGAKTQTCLLVLLPAVEADAEQPEGTTSALANLATAQEKLHGGEQHIFPFYVVPSGNELAATLRTSLGLQEDAIELITVNGKRSWWRHYDLEKGFEVSAVEDWVDAIKFGDIKKQKLPADLIDSGAAKASKDKSEL